MNKPLTDAERKQALIWIDKRKRFYRWAYFTPYERQLSFLNEGATKRERLFMAANRCGKTETGAFEIVCHLTGDYPPWWKGRRFDRPIVAWACGITSLETRDVVQEKLCGAPGVEAAFGTGMIPLEKFVDKPSLARGITDAYDTIQVRHRTGGISTCTFKSYEQGRQKFQGAGIDVVWLDEEPELAIYSECLTRIGERRGIVFMTFTPLLGATQAVLRFTDEPSADRGISMMTLEDIPPDGHIKPEDRAQIEAGYPEHERDARARGIPMLGEGRIFTASEEMISEPPLEYIPPYWVKLWGVDIGIGHPFAAALIIWDRDNDVIHLHHCFRMADTLPLHHWQIMKNIGAAVPVAWPKDAGDREKGSGEPVIKLYGQAGAQVLGIHASHPDGSISTEAGVMEMNERMKTGKFKVARQLQEFFEEYRLYHRKAGQIVKLKDDILSAVRIAVMMKRYARAVTLGGRFDPRPPVTRSKEFDLFDPHADYELT